MAPSSGRPWHPDITVASIVIHEGRLLLVEETAKGQLVLNQPAGHLEPGEDLHAAARRETLEETAWDIELTGFLGAYQWRAPETGRYYLRMAFLGNPVRHHPERALDTGIVRALWLTPEELLAERDRHRSPLVWRVVEDALAGRRLPLDSVCHL